MTAKRRFLLEERKEANRKTEELHEAARRKALIDNAVVHGIQIPKDAGPHRITRAISSTVRK